MKKSIKKSIIALTLIFAMSVGMFASADTTESLFDGRVKILNYRYLGFEVSNTGRYNIYINSTSPGSRNGTHYSADAKLRQSSGGALTKIEMNKTGDIADHWFYITGNGDVTTSINSTSTVDEPENFYVYARDKTATGKEDVYIEAIDRTLVRVDLVLVRQRRFSSNAAQQRTVNITVNGEIKPELQPKVNPIWFANRGQTIAANQLDIEKVDTSEYHYGGSYTYNSSTLTYEVPFYTRYTVEFKGNGNTGGSMANQAFVWGTAENLDKNGFTRSHRVTFDGNGGTAEKSYVDVAASFKNWTGENGSTYTDGQSVNNLTKTSRDTFTMTANWNLGSTTLPNATRAGYTFDGWYDGNTKVGNAGASYTVSKNVTLTAKWTTAPYTITYNLNGGSVATANPTSYNVESNAITLNNPTREGYIFAGWTGSNGSTAQTSVTIAKGSTGNKSYTANWTPISYTVKFNNVPGGTGTMANQTYKFDTTYNLPANAFALAYTLSYDGNGGVSDRSSDTANATFNGWEDRGTIVVRGVSYLYTTFDAPYYANEEKDVYEHYGSIYNKYSLIGHYLDWGKTEGRAPIGASPGLYPDMAAVSNLSTSPNGEVNLHANFTPTSVVLPNASRAGYTFDGWHNGTKIVGKGGETYTPTANEKLTANWTPINYTITYNLAGGSVSAANPTSYTVESNAITLNNPTKTGYTFAGWTGSNGATAQTSVTIAKGSTGDKTYTANWAVESYEITYDYNGGTDPGNPPSFTVESGEITLKNPTKTGYTFAGWTGANGSTPQTTVTISANSTGEKSYTANWTAETYTITYNLAGGSASGNPTSYTIESADISLKNPTREGYIFMGWTGSNGATAQTSVTIPTGSMGNKTYTATWLQAEYNVTWKNEDGAVLKTEKVKYNETPTYSGETPTKASTAQYEYTFKGWSPDIAPATEDATYTAQYTENTREYAITFKNEDGTVLETKPVEYGKTPTYTGATPTKAPTESEVFTFAGWSPALGSVTGEAEYTATYETAPRKYAIVWTNWDGSVLETDECEYGATPTYDGATPEKPKDNTNSYEFSSWEPAVVPVTGDATYKAVFTATELPPTADLIIETSGCKAEQSFVFTVTSNEDVTFKEIEVAIVGNGSATIKDIPTGAYTVTEENGWTWRYSDEYEKTVTVIAGEENKATFKNINEPTIKKWLSGLAALFK